MKSTAWKTENKQVKKRKRVDYSEGQQVLLRILRKCKTINTSDLIDKYYLERNINKPLYPNQAVIASIRALQKKCEFNGETFEIVTSDQRGREMLEISLIEKRR